MKYCVYCGCQNRTNGAYCENCGHSMVYENTNNYQKPIMEEKNTFWWGVLGFFIPVAGLIIFLIWLHERPKSAKSAGIGALIRTVLTIGMIIIMCFIAFIAAFDVSTVDDNDPRSVTPRYSERYDEDWT